MADYGGADLPSWEGLQPLNGSEKFNLAVASRATSSPVPDGNLGPAGIINGRKMLAQCCSDIRAVDDNWKLAFQSMTTVLRVLKFQPEIIDTPMIAPVLEALGEACDTLRSSVARHAISTISLFALHYPDPQEISHVLAHEHSMAERLVRNLLFKAASPAEKRFIQEGAADALTSISSFTWRESDLLFRHLLRALLSAASNPATSSTSAQKVKPSTTVTHTSNHNSTHGINSHTTNFHPTKGGQSSTALISSTGSSQVYPANPRLLLVAYQCIAVHLEARRSANIPSKPATVSCLLQLLAMGVDNKNGETRSAAKLVAQSLAEMLPPEQLQAAYQHHADTETCNNSAPTRTALSKALFGGKRSTAPVRPPFTSSHSSISSSRTIANSSRPAFQVGASPRRHSPPAAKDCVKYRIDSENVPSSENSAVQGQGRSHQGPPQGLKSLRGTEHVRSSEHMRTSSHTQPLYKSSIMAKDSFTAPGLQPEFPLTSKIRSAYVPDFRSPWLPDSGPNEDDRNINGYGFGKYQERLEASRERDRERERERERGREREREREREPIAISDLEHFSNDRRYVQIQSSKARLETSSSSRVRSERMSSSTSTKPISPTESSMTPASVVANAAGPILSSKISAASPLRLFSTGAFAFPQRSQKTQMDPSSRPMLSSSAASRSRSASLQPLRTSQAFSVIQSQSSRAKPPSGERQRLLPPSTLLPLPSTQLPPRHLLSSTHAEICREHGREGERGRSFGGHFFPRSAPPIPACTAPMASGLDRATPARHMGCAPPSSPRGRAHDQGQSRSQVQVKGQGQDQGYTANDRGLEEAFVFGRRGRRPAATQLPRRSLSLTMRRGTAAHASPRAQPLPAWVQT